MKDSVRRADFIIIGKNPGATVWDTSNCGNHVNKSLSIKCLTPLRLPENWDGWLPLCKIPGPQAWCKMVKAIWVLVKNHPTEGGNALFLKILDFLWESIFNIYTPWDISNNGNQSSKLLPESLRNYH